MTNTIAPLQLEQSILEALSVFQEWELQSWPVINAEGKFEGLVLEEDVMDGNEVEKLYGIRSEFKQISVQGDSHFLSAAALFAYQSIDVLPVVDKEDVLIGVIRKADLVPLLAMFAGAANLGALIVLEMAPLDFSPADLIRLVETNEAQVRQLNTQLDETSGQLWVTIRINKMEVSDIIATFQRYEYKVTYFAGEEAYKNVVRHNYQHLMHFLEI